MIVIRTAVFIAHLIVLILLLGTGLNAYLPPSWWAGLNLLSLAFPFLLGLHFILSIYWLINFRKRALIFLVGWVFLLKPTQRWVNYSMPKEKNADIRVMTYNTKSVSPEKNNFLNKQPVDIMLLQESGWKERNKMPIEQFPHQVNIGVIGLYSKFPIIAHEEIPLEENGFAFSADIRIKGKMIRVINIYLEPFQLAKDMIKPSMDVSKNEEKAKSLISRLMPVFKIHQRQVDIIKKYIEASPHPVILTGDFNSVPNSYEYYQLSKNLTDAFVEVGRGSGTSFHDYKFPIRIDYIFCSPTLQPLRYKVDRDVTLSDHFPVYADFAFK